MSFGLGGHHALVIGGSGSYLYYSFPDSGGPTAVTSPGVSAVLGYRLRTERLASTLSALYEVRRAREGPAVLPATRRTERGVAAEEELWLQATPLTVVDAIVSYSGANRYLWARAGLQRQLTNTQFRRPVALAVGVEGTTQGDRDIRVYEAGVVLALEFVHTDGSLQVRTGYARLQYSDQTSESKPYFGVALYRAF
ncbi:MAG: hypothetical protein AUH42_01815 [Gemmatimonadetes bacterium 13_1_40CM_70_11]|nr:MAG: hypothetical protein AUH42_01815 [Gemmatimonadetes bacterium 13_1_40CM_70_11]